MPDDMRLTKRLLERAVKEDEELASRVRTFANTVMDEAEHLIRHGNPYLKANLIRSLMPALSKGLQARQEDDTITQLRGEFRAMVEEMRNGNDDELVDDREIPSVVEAIAYPDERPPSSPIRAELGTT
jgi:hypothetical protein